MPISDVIEMMATRRGQEMPQIPDMLGTLQQAIQLRQQQEQQQFSNQTARMQEVRLSSQGAQQEARLGKRSEWEMAQGSAMPGGVEEPLGKAGQLRPNKDEIIDAWMDKLAELVAGGYAENSIEATKLLSLKSFTEMYLADWQPPEPQPTPRTREAFPYAAALGQGLRMPARR